LLWPTHRKIQYIDEYQKPVTNRLSITITLMDTVAKSSFATWSGIFWQAK